MTSNLATNSNLNSKALYGSPRYLEVQFENRTVPLEEQITMTSTTQSDLGNVTYVDVIPNTPVWRIEDNLAAGSVIYSLTAQGATNLVGKQTFIELVCSNGGANTVQLALPAGWNFVHQSCAVPLVRTTLTSPAMGVLGSVLHLVWSQNRCIVVGSTTGWTFA